MAFIGLKVPHDVARSLAGIPDIDTHGDPEPLDHYHVTIAHLGDAIPIEDLARTIAPVFEVTADTSPFVVTITHATCFPPHPEKGTVPLIAPIESPELHDFHARLTKALDVAGVEYSKKFPEYKPHVTLAYSSEPDTFGKFNVKLPNPVTWGVHEVVLWGGDKGDNRVVVTFPLSLAFDKAAASKVASERSTREALLYRGLVRLSMNGDRPGWPRQQRPFRRTAGFIPDKFWRDWKAGLREFLARPLRDRDPGTLRVTIEDDLVRFFQRLRDQLQRFGLHADAERSVNDRLDTVLHICTKLAESWGQFEQELRRVLDATSDSVEGQIQFSIGVRLSNLFEQRIKKVGDGLKVLWKTDHRLAKGLAARLAKKTTPEEQRAFEVLRRNEWDSAASQIVYQFDQRVNLDGLVARLVTKEKITFDFLDWLDFTRRVLTEIHTDKGLSADAAYTEYDLYGMKVVIDDRTVTPSQKRAYLRLFDRVYSALKAKKLHRIWYGTLFVRCETCGGDNPHGKMYGVGGHYFSKSDTVVIYERPSDGVAGSIVHELGHRYWFKYMSSGQRARFNALVKTYGVDTPDYFFEERATSWGRKEFQSWYEKLSALLYDVPSIDDYFMWDEKVRAAGSSVRSTLETMLHNPRKYGAPRQVINLYDHILQEGSALGGHLQTTGRMQDAVSRKNPEMLAQEHRRWVDRAKEMLADVRRAFEAYFEHGPKVWADARETDYETDERPVLPVSTYGKSDAAEAFAEVFRHYVMEHDLTRDQLESFRSVLSSTVDADVVQRVLTRWLGFAPVLPPGDEPRGLTTGRNSRHSPECTKNPRQGALGATPRWLTTSR